MIVQLNNFYVDTKTEIKTPNIQQTKQILKINSSTPMFSIQNIMSPATQNPTSKLNSKHNHIFIGDNAVQVHFDRNK